MNHNPRSFRDRMAAAGLAALLSTALALTASAEVRPDFSLAPRDQAAVFSLAEPQDGPQASAAPAGPVAPVMRKNYRRLLIEAGIMAVIATVRYWSAYHDWIEDWQYELTFEDQYRRFLTTEAIRFDSNAFTVNFSHIIGGTMYYQFARTNYLSWPQAMLTSFINSTVYEYVSEWREVISINDTFMTTFGGYAVGEPWFQLSDYFHHHKSVALHVLAFMNPINELNQWLDRKQPASKVYPAPGWTGMELTAGWWRSSETGRGTYDAARIGLDTQIVRTPEYGRPGTFKKTFRDTSFSELSIDVVLRAHQPEDVYLEGGPWEEVDFTTRTVGLASYSQKIDETGRGYALSIGLGSAMTYVRKRPTVYDSRDVQASIDPLPETPTDFRDKLAVVHVAGPVLDWTRFGKGYKVRAVTDAYVDFGMVNAFAFNAYSAVQPIEGMKSTLNYYGYSYAYGASVSGRVDADWGPFWFRGLASGHVWNSWTGRDRFQSDLTNDIGALDTRTRFLVKFGWRLPSVPLKAYFSYESIGRWGRIGDVRADSRETRTSAGLSYLF
ncbi:MAG: DUF3943 domain-containing protein [Candidatus Aminicenantes bacterium]|nr:DUF3943 domain-containing protein [Candidatus Aminicenantes bacterium]